MTSNSSNPDRTPDPDDVVEDEPESKRGEQGQASRGGDQAGPSSDESGRTIAPQKSDPMAGDRRPS